MDYYVKAEWDTDASVWFVSDTNVPGLCTEAETAEDLFRKLDVMVPELVALNCGEQQYVPFELITHRVSNHNPCH
jgi:hypothetical protein